MKLKIYIVNEWLDLFGFLRFLFKLCMHVKPLWFAKCLGDHKPLSQKVKVHFLKNWPLLTVSCRTDTLQFWIVCMRIWKFNLIFKQGAKSHAIQNLDRHHDVKFVKNLPLMGVLAEKNKVVFVTHREELVNQIFPFASISTGTYSHNGISQTLSWPKNHK